MLGFLQHLLSCMYSALPIKLDSVKPFQFPSGVGRPMYLSVYAESGGNSEEGLALFVLVVMDTLKKKVQNLFLYASNLDISVSKFLSDKILPTFPGKNTRKSVIRNLLL